MFNLKTKKKTLFFALFTFIFMIAATMVAFAEGEDAAEETVKMAGTFWALVPPIIAIVLALITKEVYSSLFVGIIFDLSLYFILEISSDITSIIAITRLPQ